MTIRIMISAFCALLLSFASLAEAQARGATAYLEGRHEELNRVIRQPAGNEQQRRARSERLRGTINGLLDYEELSRRALGDHWESRTPAQREQFSTLLRQLVERNYESNLERTLDFEIGYERESRRGELTIVHTVARSRTNRRQPPVTIDYSMVQRGSEWKVVDVATDGVSMVDNYRAQFNRIITRDGWDELIARMQRRLQSGAEDGEDT